MSNLRFRISMSPDALLGSGERLFGGFGADLQGLQLVRTVATPLVTHLEIARR